MNVKKLETKHKKIETPLSFSDFNDSPLTTHHLQSFEELPVFYEAVINNLDEALFLFDKRGRLTFVNKAGEEFIGKGLKEIRGRTFKELFSDVKEIVVLMKKAISEGRLFNCKALEVERGGAGTINVNISPFYMGHNLEGALLCIREDLSITSKEDYSFDALPYLIGSIAHEIKNPLSGIKGAAQILKGSATDPEATECVDLILKESERLNLVLHSYLTMTRKPVFNRLNIHEVIEHALKVMGPAIHDKKVRLNKSYDPSLPSIRGDESKLLQVFINLMKNAVEAMDDLKLPASRMKKERGYATEHTLTINTRPSNEYMVFYEDEGPNVKKGKIKKQRWMVIALQDTGVGIPRDEIEKIFLPFYTLKSSGSGLGLALSKKIIKDHGGIIKVVSKTGQGSTVSVYLPLEMTSGDNE
ncbi:MAG: PAS domain S-box protein [Nitrospirae bacterium]|nr:PAS domain S-box protein [Nitrospirota bacterium]